MSTTLAALRNDEAHIKEIAHAGPLAEFVRDNCYLADGHLISFAEFRARFVATLPREDRYYWSRQKVSQALRTLDIVHGARTNNQRFVANLAWSDIGGQPLRYIAVKRKGQEPYLMLEIEREKPETTNTTRTARTIQKTQRRPQR